MFSLSVIFLIAFQWREASTFSIFPVSQLRTNVELRTMDPYHERDEEAMNGPGLQIIFPGTKWCGMGNIAQNDEDYGIYKESDKCCQAHDYCPEHMVKGESKYGLHNDAFYTRLHCDCDRKFYDCLKKTNFYISDEIGFTYFNAIGTKCYREDFPIIKCFKYSWVLKKRCSVYELDNSKPRIWQWFDLPIY